MNQFEGHFISVEGIDRSGKSTVIEGLKDELGDGYEFTHEPSTGKYGRIVREELKSDSDPNMADFYLFLADRYDHCQSLIGPKLSNGENVICDRYQLSTFAYQSPIVRQAINAKSGIQYIDSMTDPWVIYPDLTLYIDVPVEVSLDRMDGDSEKYEKRDNLERAKGMYDYMWENNDHIKKIDGLQPKQEVLSDCLALIRNLDHDTDD